MLNLVRIEDSRLERIMPHPRKPPQENFASALR
jgi:hypothetical protein